MVFKRRRPTKPAFGRKKARTVRARRPTKLSSHVFRLKRTGIVTVPWTVSNVTTNDFWRYENPSAGLCNNFGELQACFDQYKVNAIKVTYMPRFGEPAFPITGNTPMTTRRIFATIVKDPESQLVPAGTYTYSQLNTLRENGGYTVSAHKPFSVYYKPKVAINSAVGSALIYKSAPWMSTDSTSTGFRGFHIFFHQEGMGTTFTDVEYDRMYTFYMELKNPR